MSGGNYKSVQLPQSVPWSSSDSYFMLWGGYVALVSIGANAGTSVVYNSRFFERANLDAWLTRIKNYYGMPN